MKVWYVKVGHAGYGPDLDSEDEGYETLHATLDGIRWELDSIGDSEHDAAESYAAAGDFETAWHTAKLVDSFGILRANLDIEKRAHAPLYVDNPTLLVETMERLVAENFPLDIEVNGSRRLYVWEADDQRCDATGNDGCRCIEDGGHDGPHTS